MLSNNNCIRTSVVLAIYHCCILLACTTVKMSTCLIALLFIAWVGKPWPRSHLRPSTSASVQKMHIILATSVMLCMYEILTLQDGLDCPQGSVEGTPFIMKFMGFGPLKFSESEWSLTFDPFLPLFVACLIRR